jgi:outer membrane protein insertion porin family
VFGSLFAALAWAPPHPALDALGVQLHAFVNGGNTLLLSSASSSSRESQQPSSSSSGGSSSSSSGPSLFSGLKSVATQFGSSIRWSTGLGLVFPTMLGRFEANYVWVLSSQDQDRVHRGLQFGFAANGGSI